MFKAYRLAFEQLSDPKVRRIVWISLAFSVVTYIALCVGLTVLFFNTTLLSSLPFWETLIDWAAVIIIPIAALLLLPSLNWLFMGLFLEDVAAAVEDRHYPGMPAPRKQSIRELLSVLVRLNLMIFALNLVLLPFYLLVPILGVALYWAVNAYVVGRDCTEIVALRHLPPEQVKRLHSGFSGKAQMVGLVATGLMAVPILNLITPVIAVAAMTHVIHGLPKQPLRAGTLEVNS